MDPTRPKEQSSAKLTGKIPKSRSCPVLFFTPHNRFRAPLDPRSLALHEELAPQMTGPRTELLAPVPLTLHGFECRALVGLRRAVSCSHGAIGPCT
jgi:hypothetical protein